MKMWAVCALVLAALCLVPPLYATVGYVTVSSSLLQNSSGSLVNNATACFRPVNNAGAPVSYQVNGAGQAIFTPVCAPVVRGVFNVTLADTNLTAPQNICFSMTVVSTMSGNSLLGPGYNCLQPTANNSWCTSSVCNFDAYQPSLSPLALVSPCSAGPAGPAVQVSSCGGTVGAANGTQYSLSPAAPSCSSGSPPPPNVITKSCTASNLYAQATAVGSSAGSGVVTLYTATQTSPNAYTATALSCTLGTGLYCADTTDTVALAAGMLWRLEVTTGQASDTTANVGASFQCQ